MYLVIIVEFLVIPLNNKLPGKLVGETDSVVEITEP